MRLDWEPNQKPPDAQDEAPPIEPHQLGYNIFLNDKRYDKNSVTCDPDKRESQTSARDIWKDILHGITNGSL